MILWLDRVQKRNSRLGARIDGDTLRDLIILTRSLRMAVETLEVYSRQEQDEVRKLASSTLDKIQAEDVFFG